MSCTLPGGVGGGGETKIVFEEGPPPQLSVRERTTATTTIETKRPRRSDGNPIKDIWEASLLRVAILWPILKHRFATKVAKPAGMEPLGRLRNHKYKYFRLRTHFSVRLITMLALLNWIGRLSTKQWQRMKPGSWYRAGGSRLILTMRLTLRIARFFILTNRGTGIKIYNRHQFLPYVVFKLLLRILASHYTPPFPHGSANEN